jgi:hypothetical protein
MSRGGRTSDGGRGSCEGRWMRAEEGSGVEGRPAPAEGARASNGGKGFGRAEEENGDSGGCVLCGGLVAEAREWRRLEIRLGFGHAGVYQILPRSAFW